jgi:hypothetical protein
LPEPLRFTKLTLVEGKDEVNFYSALNSRTGQVETDIRSFEGVNNLRGTLEALRGIEGFDRLTALGIVRDAEGNGNAAFQSVRDALRDTGFAVPDRGLERAGAGPAVIVLINPDERSAGRFEDVCADSVRGTPVMRCVEEYIACLKGLGEGMLAREWKTRIHAFIAAQEHPEVSLGVAAKYGYFPFDHKAFATVRRLFELLAAS